MGNVLPAPSVVPEAVLLSEADLDVATMEHRLFASIEHAKRVVSSSHLCWGVRTVSLHDLLLPVGNHKGNGVGGAVVTLHDYLVNLDQYLSYPQRRKRAAQLEGNIVSVEERAVWAAQGCFLPCASKEATPVEFTPRIYFERSADPQLVITACSAGTSAQYCRAKNLGTALYFNRAGVRERFSGRSLVESRRARGTSQNAPISQKDIARNCLIIICVPLEAIFLPLSAEEEEEEERGENEFAECRDALLVRNPCAPIRVLFNFLRSNTRPSFDALRRVEYDIENVVHDPTRAGSILVP